MSTQDVARKVLARAAAYMGGPEALAAKFQLSPRVLQHYLTGSERIPDALLLQAIDVILEKLPSIPVTPAVPQSLRAKLDP
jgi:hypothetical protein